MKTFIIRRLVSTLKDIVLFTEAPGIDYTILYCQLNHLLQVTIHNQSTPLPKLGNHRFWTITLLL